MNRRTVCLVLSALLLVCLLLLLIKPARQKEQPPAALPSAEENPVPPSPSTDDPEDAAQLAGQIQPDPTSLPGLVIPAASSAAPESQPVTVEEGSVLYAYEGMTVTCNGGTVYSTGATVINNGGTVFCNGGTVMNNGGIVYAKAGTVFHLGGTVYNGGADIVMLPGDDAHQESRIFGYHELKLADYYEPYVVLEGIVSEPGSERTIIGEDSVCRATPKAGYRIASAESDSGELVWDAEDGSVSLINVTGDTTLKLTIERAGS